MFDFEQHQIYKSKWFHQSVFKDYLRVCFAKLKCFLRKKSKRFVININELARNT